MLEKLRYRLMCPTSDCEAKLSFVVGGKILFLIKHQNQLFILCRYKDKEEKS